MTQVKPPFSPKGRPKKEPNADQRKKAADPQTRAVADMKDSRGKGSSKAMEQDAPKPVRVKGGGRRKGTPKGGAIAPAQIDAQGVPLTPRGARKPGRESVPQPSDVGGEGSGKRLRGGADGEDIPAVRVNAPTASKAAGPSDLEAARRLRVRVLDVMQRHPYRIPHAVAAARIGDLDYAAGTTGTFDTQRAIQFLSAHDQHRENNPRSVPMDHPWLGAADVDERVRARGGG